MRNTALLLVDIQQDFWEPFKELEEYSKLPENVDQLRRHFREKGQPVIHVKSVFKKDRSDWMLFYRPEGRGTIPCIEGTEGVGFTEFSEPLEGEKVVGKTVFDAFNGTGLLAHLVEAGIKSVVVAGIETSVCVLFTATSAYLNGILPVVAIDACADSPERHKSTIEMYGDLCFKALTTNQITGESGELESLVETFT